MPQTLSDATIRAAKPAAQSYTLWDNGLANFGCRVYPAGAKSFVVLLGSGRRQTIGRYPLISLSDARSEARRILAEKTLGKVRPKFHAFEDARDAFIRDCESRLRPLSVKLYKRHLTVHYTFGRSNLADITPRQIQDKLKKLKPSEREHAHRIGRTFFRWCVSEPQHFIERSPMEDMAPPPKNRSRERVLTVDELRAVYATAMKGTTIFHHFIALLTLLALRRTECASLEWSFFKDGLLTIPGTLTKNRRTHIIPYGPTVAGLLENIPRLSDTYLFPAARKTKGTPVMTGFSERKRDFDTECGVTGWTHHDLRRTFSTSLADMDVAPHITERLLNHVSGEVSDVAAIYNRSRYAKPCREAIEQWDAYLATLLQPQGVES